MPEPTYDELRAERDRLKALADLVADIPIMGAPEAISFWCGVAQEWKDKAEAATAERDRLGADRRRDDLHREKQRQRAARFMDALIHIAAGRQCEKVTAPPYCRQDESLTRDAVYEAERWCDTCIALDALDQTDDGAQAPQKGRE